MLLRVSRISQQQQLLHQLTAIDCLYIIKKSIILYNWVLFAFERLRFESCKWFRNADPNMLNCSAPSLYHGCSLFLKHGCSCLTVKSCQQAHFQFSDEAICHEEWIRRKTDSLHWHIFVNTFDKAYLLGHSSQSGRQPILQTVCLIFCKQLSFDNVACLAFRCSAVISINFGVVHICATTVASVEIDICRD
ncbi:hypothetical protein D917_02527 [Trichinella nativa]|uniref:Uncharacterized protein n=1 Tax=Trichinella nativa TaxID=6335 RepID=A0A1Y3E2W9_9BILA|nr:hypothetical protein D917_02527 [Trichinella nativa]